MRNSNATGIASVLFAKKRIVNQLTQKTKTIKNDKMPLQYTTYHHPFALNAIQSYRLKNELLNSVIEVVRPYIITQKDPNDPAPRDQKLKRLRLKIIQ
jgi:hypothetical protein